MNPSDGLPFEALQVIEVYSFIGMVSFAVLGLWEIDKATRRARTKAPIFAPLRTGEVVWRYCADGHHKVLTDHVDARCVVCGGPMLVKDRPYPAPGSPLASPPDLPPIPEFDEKGLRPT